MAIYGPDDGDVRDRFRIWGVGTASICRLYGATAIWTRVLSIFSSYGARWGNLLLVRRVIANGPDQRHRDPDPCYSLHVAL
jgi:hypothetical protein